jgi:ABC-type uncharacterized transport system substrate-binding protein
MSDIRRREFMILLGGAAAWPLAARAQQPDRVRRVGVLMGISDDAEGQARIAVFRQALQALGLIQGRNVQFIYRWSAGDVLHARQFAKELLDLRSDVILANSTPVAAAVRDTTHAHGICPGKRPGHRRCGPQLGATRWQSHRLHEFRALDGCRVA